MFNPTQIDDRVKKTLFNKIDAVNRKRLDGSDKNFFVGESLEPQDDTNPIEQHLYRGCFAKVNVAVPEFTDDKSDVIRKPVSISSYITNNVNEKNQTILENKNSPLAFRQGHQEKVDNRFLGESGITSISVSQLEYYTYKFTIGWVCPDPVYFEKTFEPSFLKLGAYAAIEFGWGNGDKSMDQIESLSIEEMEKLLKIPGRLTERNLKSSANYYCGVGTVTKFDWKIQENGIYAGDIQILTPGASPFLDTPQGTSNSADTIPVRKIKNTLELQSLAKRLLEDEKARNDLTTEEIRDLKKELVSATTIKETLQANSVAFNLAIKNLDKVSDYFLEKEPDEKFFDPKKEENTSKPYFTEYTDLKRIFRGGENRKYETSKYISALSYQYSGGLMKIDVKKSWNKTTGFANRTADRAYPPEDFLKKRYFASWGWFEDNILKTFFEIKSGDKIIQTVDSRKVTKTQKSAPPVATYNYEYKDNRCGSTDYLYSMGLDSVILPGKHHPILERGFSDIDNEGLLRLIRKYYPLEQRINLDRINLIYLAIDKVFPKFNAYDYSEEQTAPANLVEQEPRNVETGKPKYGIIRNMVFPIEMFQKHFQNTPSLRQGLRNFWADVTNQYGGYWGFELGQDGDNQTHIGVFDSYYDNIKTNDTKKKSNKDNLNGIFEFSVFSNKSIVKSFDVNLDLSAEAATLARYGGFTNAKRGTTRIDGKKELGIEAWNILTSDIDEKDVKTLEDLKRYREIRQEVLKDLKYTNEEDGNFMNDKELIEQLSEDDQKIIEKVETKRHQFVQGIGCYDNRGNFSTYFKQTMLHLILYSDLENSGSLIERSRPILPISISMTLDGISGLAVGNLFKVDYLPKLYREPYIYFQITKVEHKITTAGWDTDIEAVMRADMPEFWKTSGRNLNQGLDDYIKLFKLTNVDELQGELFKAFTDGREITLDEITSYDNQKELVAFRINIFNSKKEEGNYDEALSIYGTDIGESNKQSNLYYINEERKILIRKHNTLQDFLALVERTDDAAKFELDFETFDKFVADFLKENNYKGIRGQGTMQRVPKREDNQPLVLEEFDVSSGPGLTQKTTTQKVISSDEAERQRRESGGSSGGGSSNRGGFNFGSSKGDAITSQDY
tara:strand:- start:563 stop:3937 length:3375 start_codon:yes stop_codon:yes gene_type:complete